MTCESGTSYRQTYPVDHGNGNIVRNFAETPVIGKKPLTELSVFIAPKRLICDARFCIRPVNRTDDGDFDSGNDMDGIGNGHRRILRGQLVTPQATLPLTALFKTCCGGGRPGGGGTSKEALRRAKRKARLAK